jgi:hypothetical protein
MMYTTGLLELQLAAEQLLTSTGDKVFYAPTLEPFVVRAFGIVITTAITTNPLLLTLEQRPTAGSDTGRTVVATLNLTVASAFNAQGKSVYKHNLNQKILPGGELVVKVGGTAPVAGAATIGMLVEPYTEVPANNANMSLTT